MKITVICNCGVLIEDEKHCLLADGLTESCFPFYALPRSERERIVNAKPPYQRLRQLYFTHRHDDHFSLAAVRAFAAAHGAVEGFLPEENDPDELCFGEGDFQVECHRFTHSGAEYAEEPHFVLLVSMSGKLVYLSADAQPDIEKHLQILNGRVPDAAFYNGQYLSGERTREYLRMSAKQNYIYHVPLDEQDVSGIRRKCHRNFERYGQELENTTLIEAYPTVLII